MLYIIAQMLDTYGIYEEIADSIYDSFKSGNQSANGAVQQQVNGAYRSTEMLYVITLICN